MISFGDNSLAKNFIELDELKKICPTAFAKEKTNPHTSDRYDYVSTENVINDLAKKGWFPVQAKQCRKNKNSSGIRSFHMIAFQNENVSIRKMNEDGTPGDVDTYPRIILTTSHDGFNSFKFMVGLFRLVCSNGLVVSDGEIASITIRHINYNEEELQKVIDQTVEFTKIAAEKMTVMKNTEVTAEQKREIATEVVKIRKNAEEDEKIDIDEATIMDILCPVREEDESDDLWTVYNMCQEKLIKGGFSAKGKNNKVRKQRSITSIKKDIEYNQRLWDVIARYVPATVAA